RPRAPGRGMSAAKRVRAAVPAPARPVPAQPAEAPVMPELDFKLVADKLAQRVAALTADNAVKDAYIDQLTARIGKMEADANTQTTPDDSDQGAPNGASPAVATTPG
ncbi:MAG: hypothetical protein LC792_15005, partial [Actinobacteria bacterium]|nr:hypothetical protein [Actinomycetota bacterium]